MSAGLDERLAALGEAAAIAEGRLDDHAVTRARSVVARAGERLGLGVEATVVALAGPTGAGKSTLFNALAGGDLVPTSVRRPTTSAASAAVWGGGAGPLLDWLDVRRRFDRDGSQPDGLVLVDLPDFDSVEHAHRLEADRMIGLVDLLVWVVDPQKYADAALHDRYLRPLAGHAGAMLVVLNQADVLAGAAAESLRSDLCRLLEHDGLGGVPVLAVSARTGLGLDALGAALAERVARREAAVARLAADVGDAAARLDAGCSGNAPAEVAAGDRDRLVRALGEAAGVPSVVRAVERGHRRAGALETGWPPTRWVRRLRPDPLRRLGLGERAALGARTGLPAPTPVARAQVDSAVRTAALGAAGGLPEPWPRLARAAAGAREDELADRLDRAVAGADPGGGRRPRWWTVAFALQRGLLAIAAIGALWLLVLAGLGFLHVSDVVPMPDIRSIPVPTAMLVGAALVGLLLAFLARLVNGAAARRRARRAERRLRAAVAEVAGDLVLGPLRAELDARDRLCAALATARDEPRRRGLLRR